MATAAAENEENESKVIGPLIDIPYPNKIVVHFRPVGSAPILKQKKFKVGSDKLFSSLTKFLKSQLKLQSNDQIVNFLSDCMDK